jgi:DNA-binding MarR family transcriptional regulator
MGLAVERFVAAIETRSIALMLKLNVTMPQLRALTAIRRHGRVSGRQLAGTLNVTPGAVVAICDHLEQRGYVRRVADTSDRRITWFEVTEQGEAALNYTPTVARTIARSRKKALLDSLTSTERESFIKILDGMASILEAESENSSEDLD